MVFVGNTDHSVPYMLKHSDLFDALPKDYYDKAFLDRMHAYLPGWEVQKLRNEMFTEDYGFIVDYLAEILKDLRKEDRTHDYNKYFELSDTITTRDKTSISKTFAGLAKVIYPHGEMDENESKELLDFAIENRKRVKQQFQKMDETFEEVDFSYTIKSSKKKVNVETVEILENGVKEITLPTSNMEAETISSDEVKGLIDEVPKRIELEGGQKIISDNQSGIS